MNVQTDQPTELKNMDSPVISSEGSKSTSAHTAHCPEKRKQDGFALMIVLRRVCGRWGGWVADTNYLYPACWGWINSSLGLDQKLIMSIF